MSDGGKGDTYRPTDKQKFDQGYDRIFGRKDKTPVCPLCGQAHDKNKECSKNDVSIND
jgi:hypothetical protein